MNRLSLADQETKIRHQLALVDKALTKEFSTIEPDVVHREVAAVSEELLKRAHFTDHVAVLTGRFAHENLEETLAPAKHHPQRSTEDPRHITKSHWWALH